MKKINQNQIRILAAGLITALAFLYLITSARNCSNIKAISNQKVVISDALTKIVKPDKKAKKKSELEKIQSKEPYLFMIDETDYRPFQLDDLLDPNDRTIESERAIFNYNNLLEITHTLNALKKETLSLDDIRIKDIQVWVKMLIYDEYYRNAKYNNLNHNIDIANLNQITIDTLPTEDELSERMSKSCLKGLINLEKLSSNLSNDNAELKNIAINKIKQFSNRSIDYSNNFFRTKIKHYFLNKDLTVDSKVFFTEMLIESKNLSLYSYINDYLALLLKQSNDINQRATIQELIAKIEVYLK